MIGFKKFNLKLFFLVSTTVLSFVIAYFCLVNQVYTVYQNLFFVPIILACFWYEKKGILFSVAVAVIHILAYARNTNNKIEDEVARFFVFVGIAVLIEVLSGRINRQRKTVVHLNRSLQNDLERFRVAEQLANCGNWEMNLKTHEVRWSDGLYRLFGYEPQSFEPTYEKRMEIAYPDDRDFVRETIDRSIRNRESTRIESRIVRPDGSVRWLSSVGHVEYDENGEPQDYIGSFLDITDRKEAEAKEHYNLKRNESTIRIFTRKTNNGNKLLQSILEEAIQLTESEAGILLSYHEKEQKTVYFTCSKKTVDLCAASEQELAAVAGPQLKKIAGSGRPVLFNREGGFRTCDFPDWFRFSKFMIVPVEEDESCSVILCLANRAADYTLLDASQAGHFLTDAWQSFKRNIAESLLYREQEKYKTTITSIGDGVISTDVEGRVTILNRVAEAMTGWTQEEALGRPLEEVFHIIHEYTKMECENPVQKVLQSGLIIGLANHTALISKDGTERSIADSAAPIRDYEGSIQGVVLVFRDVTEEKRRQAKVKYISYHDSLTGLYNRRYFEEQLKKIDTSENLPVSIIMGDVNALKITNDAFGHVRGDELLRKASSAIQNVCRGEDVAARWGGDEFVILLPRTPPERAASIVNDIRSEQSKMKVCSIRVSVSFGCGTKERKEEDIREALKNAEDHMYEQKVVESESMRGSLVKTILRTLHEKSPQEEQHSLRVSKLCVKTGMAMGLSKNDLSKLKVIGLLHDIGKIGVSESILNKPGKLTDKEWDEVKRHPDIGYRILQSSKEMSSLADYILSHHERVDGSGYPRGLKDREIPLLSKIVSVADAYDAMTSDRSYRKALDPRTAASEILKGKGGQFDSAVVDCFLKTV